MVEYRGLLADLAAEEAELDAVVAGIDGGAWLTPTPAEGWDVRDSIAHLAYSEELAATTLVEPDTFAERLAAMLADLAATERTMLAAGRARPGPEVLRWWRDEATGSWPNCDAASLATACRGSPARCRQSRSRPARLMETWTPGRTSSTALGVGSEPTARLRHVADLGVRARARSG